MKRSEKIKESQYLWKFEKEGMLQSNKERYGPLIEVLDPLIESGIVTYNEWVDRLSDTFQRHALNYPADTLEDRSKIVEVLLTSFLTK